MIVIILLIILKNLESLILLFYNLYFTTKGLQDILPFLHPCFYPPQVSEHSMANHPHLFYLPRYVLRPLQQHSPQCHLLWNHPHPN